MNGQQVVLTVPGTDSQTESQYRTIRTRYDTMRNTGGVMTCFLNCVVANSDLSGILNSD